MKKIGFLLFVIIMFFTKCNTNNEISGFKQFSDNEVYRIINDIYSEELDNGIVYLLSVPRNPNSLEDTIVTINNIQFYNLIQYNKKGDYIEGREGYLKDLPWNKSKLNKNFNLLEFGDFNNIVNDNYIYEITIPLSDNTGNYALIKEGIFSDLYYFLKYRIFKKTDHGWVLDFEYDLR